MRPQLRPCRQRWQLRLWSSLEVVFSYAEGWLTIVMVRYLIFIEEAEHRVIEHRVINLRGRFVQSQGWG